VLRVRKIDSLDLPELQPYRTMRRQMEHRQQGLFVAEGEKVVRRLLESRFTVVSALLPEKWFRDLEPVLRSRAEPIDIFIGEKKLLEGLTGFSMYQGLLALGKIPPQRSLEEVLKAGTASKDAGTLGEARPWLFVAADGLSSAENMGVLVRNCAAFGAHALLVGETCSSPFLRRAVRSSMGTIFELPVVEMHKLAAALQCLRRAGIKCVAAHPHLNGRTPSMTDLRGDCCLVFGSEGYGLSSGVLNACDDAAAIPMSSKVDSLNVGSAASAFLYEANRQRGRM
jgi:tRNA G18 (ribose-2'-O)-methylase SpoU